MFAQIPTAEQGYKYFCGFRTLRRLGNEILFEYQKLVELMKIPQFVQIIANINVVLIEYIGWILT